MRGLAEFEDHFAEFADTEADIFLHVLAAQVPSKIPDHRSRTAPTIDNDLSAYVTGQLVDCWILYGAPEIETD